MNRTPNLADAAPELMRRASVSMDDADAKLNALKDLLWLMVENGGPEGGHWAAFAYGIEAVRADLNKAGSLLIEVRR